MDKIKIRESVYVLKEKNNPDSYSFVFTSTRKIKEFELDDLAKEVISYLTQEEKEASILKAKLAEKYSPDKIDLCLKAMESEGIINRFQEDQIFERHNRQILFLNELTSSWEETKRLQKKIEKAKISIFGVGGIGTWIVNGLSQIGVGEIRISDPDIVEESNLGRQLYFNYKDLGRHKVEVIKEKLPDSKIQTFKKRVSTDTNLEEIVSGADFLVNCADSPSVSDTTEIIDSYATKYSIPYCVAGGYNMHLGMVGPLIIPGKTASFQDFLEYQKRNDPLKNLELVKDIKQTGSLGPIAGAVANIQVMEIFKYLTGKGKLNINRFAEIDFMDFNVTWREFQQIQPKTF